MSILQSKHFGKNQIYSQNFKPTDAIDTVPDPALADALCTVKTVDFAVTRCFVFYRPCNIVLSIKSFTTICLSVKKPGCKGIDSSPLLPSIRTTVDMFGLSSGDCCTHKRAMWIERIISST